MPHRNMTGGLLVALTLIVLPLALVGLQTYQIRARGPQLTQNREWCGPTEM